MGSLLFGTSEIWVFFFSPPFFRASVSLPVVQSLITKRRKSVDNSHKSGGIGKNCEPGRKRQETAMINGSCPASVWHDILDNISLFLYNYRLLYSTNEICVIPRNEERHCSSLCFIHLCPKQPSSSTCWVSKPALSSLCLCPLLQTRVCCCKWDSDQGVCTTSSRLKDYH